VTRYLILGLVQGLTEFLPVSSSGHLVILQHFFGLKGPSNILLDALLHFGTVLAVLILFRKKIGNLILSLFTDSREDRKYLLNIIIATVPIAVIGFTAQDAIESAFTSLRATGVGLLITGLLLGAVRYIQKSNKEIDVLTWRDSILVGFAQATALFPGISRSGVTISAGISRKLKPEFAAEFSFLLMVPAVLGATAFKIWDGIITNPNPLPGDLIIPYVLSTIIATVFGAFAITWLINLLKQGKFSLFSYYCLILGGITLILSFT